MSGLWRRPSTRQHEHVDLGLPAWSPGDPPRVYRRRHCTHPVNPIEIGMVAIEHGRFDTSDGEDPWPGEEAYNRGVVLMERGDIDGAIEQYRASIQVSPDHPAPRSNLGIALIQRGQREAGLDHLRAALEFDRSDALFLRNLAAGLMACDEREAAFELLEEAAAHNPTSADIPALMATLYDYDGDDEEHERALHWARLAVELDPDEIAHADNLGTRLAMAGRHEEAIHWFERAIELDPSHPLPYFNLGSACWRAGQLERAEAAYRKHLELEPEHSCAMYDLARIRSELEDEPGALELFHGYRELEPNDPAAVLSIGISSLILGNHADARVHLDAALRADPGLHWAVYMLGKLALTEEDPARAEACAREALRRQPDMIPAFGTLMDMLIEQERVSDLFELAAEDPSGERWGTLVMALIDAGSGKAALIAAKRSIAQNPEDGWRYAMLAQVLEDRDRPKESLAQWRIAQQRMPTDYRVPLGIARVQAKLGNAAAARPAVEASIDLLPEGAHPEHEHLAILAWCHTSEGRLDEARAMIERIEALDPDDEFAATWRRENSGD